MTVTDNKPHQKFLVIQTAFIGDVILATALLEKLNQCYPESKIDFLVRKGNEQLFDNHPYINRLWVWDKKRGKFKNLLGLGWQLRAEKYDYTINCQRFFSSGLLTVFSGARCKIGFDKNPLAFLFDRKIKHQQKGLHETQRNQKLIEVFTDQLAAKPKLYPPINFENLKTYITISPASVWFTKQFPKEKWIELIDLIPDNIEIHLLGGPGDKNLCEEIMNNNRSRFNIFNQAGRLTLLESAGLMKGAILNFVNDSAPMHLSSAVNAPTCAIYCSTVQEFGYGPLADFSRVVEIDYDLECRPCGLHGYKTCPQKHFRCAKDIKIDFLTDVLRKAQEIRYI